LPGVELVDEVGREEVGVAGDQRALRLRRIGVEDRLMGSVYAACRPVSCWKRYQTLLAASMVWSILRTMRFSLSELFIDCVRLLAQPPAGTPSESIGRENGRGEPEVSLRARTFLVEGDFLRLGGKHGSGDRIAPPSGNCCKHILL